MFPSAPRMGLSMMPVSNPNSSHGRAHPLASGLVQLGIAHDAALADLALAHFKLRFDQYNHLRRRGRSRGTMRGQDQRHRNEAHVADERGPPARRSLRSVRSRALMPSCSDHARIGAQLPIELARADIHGVHARRAALQQAHR